MVFLKVVVSSRKLKAFLLMGYFGIFLLSCDNYRDGGPPPPPPSQTQLNQTLFSSIKNRDLNALLIALKQGANPNAVDENGNTPAMEAAKTINGQAFAALVRYGADLTIKNNGKTALDMVSDTRNIEQLGNEIKKLDQIGKVLTEEEKAELNTLQALSSIKRYAEAVNFQMPESLTIVPNPGAGSCFFYSIAPMLKEIFPAKAIDFSDPQKIRDWLAASLQTAGFHFNNMPIQDYIGVLKAGEGNAIYGKVQTPNDLADLITNSGPFKGNTFWGDDFTDGLAKQLANLTVIKINQDRFEKGRDIFYCQSDVNTTYVGFMKYYQDVHFEAMKYKGTDNGFTFKRNNMPTDVKKVVDAYNLNCKSFWW